MLCQYEKKKNKKENRRPWVITDLFPQAKPKQNKRATDTGLINKETTDNVINAMVLKRVAM